MVSVGSGILVGAIVGVGVSVGRGDCGDDWGRLHARMERISDVAIKKSGVKRFIQNSLRYEFVPIIPVCNFLMLGMNCGMLNCDEPGLDIP